MTADTGRNGHILVCNSNTYTDILVCVHSRSTNTDISFIVIQINPRKPEYAPHQIKKYLIIE